MTYGLEANIRFGVHNSSVHTFLQVFSKGSLVVDIDVLTVAESSEDLIRGRRLLTFPSHVRRLIEGGAYSSKYATRERKQCYANAKG